MNANNTKNQGVTAELSTILLFQKNGYQISIPFGENSPYDFIAESNTGKVYKIQVRTGKWDEKGVLGLRLRSVSKNYSRPVDFDRIDVFVIFDGQDHFLVPCEKVNNLRALFSIRKELPKNGQTNGIHWAKDYLEDFSISVIYYYWFVAHLGER